MPYACPRGSGMGGVAGLGRGARGGAPPTRAAFPAFRGAAGRSANHHTRRERVTTRRQIATIVTLLVAAGMLAGCASPGAVAAAPPPIPTFAAAIAEDNSATDPGTMPTAQVMTEAASEATLRFVLESGLAEGRMGFIGRSPGIEGSINPTLRARPGEVVEITLISGEGAEHDVAIQELGVASARGQGKGASITVTLRG